MICWFFCVSWTSLFLKKYWNKKNLSKHNENKSILSFWFLKQNSRKYLNHNPITTEFIHIYHTNLNTLQISMNKYFFASLCSREKIWKLRWNWKKAYSANNNVSPSQLLAVVSCHHMKQSTDRYLSSFGVCVDLLLRSINDRQLNNRISQD